MNALLGLTVAVAVLAGCASAPRAENFAGLVEIDTGRTLFLNCQGAGAPTVFIIPGKTSYADEWNVVLAPDDPIRSSPHDLIDRAQLVPSSTATQPTVAETTGSAPTTGRTPGRMDQIGPLPSRNHTASSRMSTMSRNSLRTPGFRPRWSSWPIPTAG